MSRKPGVVGRSRRPPNWRLQALRNGLDYTEVLSAICGFFCKGHGPAEIKRLMVEQHGVELTREEPYQYLLQAAQGGFLSFNPPPELALRELITRKCGLLRSVRVVHSAVFEDVSAEGAKALLQSVQQIHGQKQAQAPTEETNVHIGFSGGHAMRRLAKSFAEELAMPAVGADLPDSLTLHALVTGFDIDEPTTDPNAFFTYFGAESELPLEVKFVGLHAPPMVDAKDFEHITQLTGIREAYERRDEIDIVVASASLRRDDHNVLKKYMNRSKDWDGAKVHDLWQADMLWQPLGEEGPVPNDASSRAMTLVDLADLQRLIGEGKRVLLVVGPCSQCGNPKGEVLPPILGTRPQLITDLVVDSRSARALID